MKPTAGQRRAASLVEFYGVGWKRRRRAYCRSASHFVGTVDERAALAKDLLLSLDGDPEPGAEQAWIEELDRRVQAVANGTATLVTWDEG